MASLHCQHRSYTITADVVEHPGIPTPWAGGCHITDPEGHTSKRIALPVRFAFLADLENAQRASIAHGKWLVDQRLTAARRCSEAHTKTALARRAVVHRGAAQALPASAVSLRRRGGAPWLSSPASGTSLPWASYSLPSRK